MRKRLIFLALPALVAGCIPAGQPPLDPGRRPLDTQPAEARLADVEADLLATAREKLGDADFERLLDRSTHLIVKRFVGMSPPPPPGAGADWRPPTPSAILYKDGNHWWVASSFEWRQVTGATAAELDAILPSEAFRDEAGTIPACPDFGASNLLLKMPGKARIVRSHQCSSATTRAIEAALRA